MNNIVNGVRIDSPKMVTLCGDKVCCPSLEMIDDNTFKLTDDDGNSVILTKEQAALIDKGVTLLESNSRSLICG